MHSSLKILIKHLLIAILTAYFFNWLNTNFFEFKNSSQNALKDLSQGSKIIVILILGPLIETLIFQLPLLYFRKTKAHFLFLIVMCFLFASTHLYNPIYFVFAFFLGLNFNLFFVKIKKGEYINEAFILTFLLHLFFNLYGLLFV